jgi:2-polyprenyl-6-methoxyphenol hydroxylase-like FAD-dependent oxidoreductase
MANGSRVIALPGDERTVRGYSAAALIIVDEAARVEDALWTAVRPMLVRQSARAFANSGWSQRLPMPLCKQSSMSWCPRLCSERVILLGDAAFVVRPHTAEATAKAAHDAWVLGRNLGRAKRNYDAGLKAAESLQLDYGNNLIRYGIALGSRWASTRTERPATP